MPWKIEPLHLDAIDETETWRKRFEEGVLQATYSITYQSGYAVVSARPKIDLVNPKGPDVYHLNSIDEESNIVSKEGWEWPWELNNDEIELFETMYREQPMSLYGEGWSRVARRRMFFGPLALTKCK